MKLGDFAVLAGVVAALVGLIACGSAGQRPTLPAPEFEPPTLTPWDAGIEKPAPDGAPADATVAADAHSDSATAAGVVGPGQSSAQDHTTEAPGTEPMVQPSPSQTQ